MLVLRMRSRRTRLVRTTALSGAMAIALVSGPLVSATTANADTLSCLTTSGTTTLVSTTGSGTGLINSHSTGGVIGVATDADGAQIGLLRCNAVVSIGGTTPNAPAATIETPVTTPSTPSGTPTTATPMTPTTPTTDAQGPASASEPTTTKVSTVKVTTSTATVYPSAKGYSKSKVTFSIKGLTSADGAVKITGKAVLTKGTRIVKTWKINSSTAQLTWNGRIGKKVKAGVYKLTVTARSSDGTKKISTMKVRVSAKHLVTRTATMRTRNLADASTGTLPSAVRKAFKYGKVTLRVHTVARVSGPANIIAVGPHGEKITIPLKDGSHTTKSAVLPKGFTSAKFAHDWKKGDATLIGLYTTFSYKALV